MEAARCAEQADYMGDVGRAGAAGRRGGGHHQHQHLPQRDATRVGRQVQ